MGQPLKVKYPEGAISFGNTGQSPVWSWRLVILNYLSRADNTPVADKLIAYREVENGQVFYPAFLRESIKPLAKTLADRPVKQIEQACLKLSARLDTTADVCAVFDFLPRFPVTVKLWLKDEEVEGSANILFAASATITCIRRV